uniref:Uncharacterized protein n=1 Tax=Trypanosoma congolense (strain IL3000) TaxID=1068625 RepID=F9WFD4_TRYCI|nr:hypothetical protein, unlikely [Trypanosoma congolense IL3000]
MYTTSLLPSRLFSHFSSNFALRGGTTKGRMTPKQTKRNQPPHCCARAAWFLSCKETSPPSGCSTHRDRTIPSSHLLASSSPFCDILCPPYRQLMLLLPPGALTVLTADTEAVAQRLLRAQSAHSTPPCRHLATSGDQL